MAKPGLGTKRLCPHCGAKFYDLEKDPIMCPKCGSEVEIVLPTSRGRPEPRKAVAEAESDQTDEATVPLEDADAEESGGKVAKAPTDDDDVEVEDDESEDDDTFLEDEEDGDDDVSDIIGGDIDKEDES